MAEVLPDGSIPVLDHGFVRLDDAMADDLSVVNSARVSFGRRVAEMGDADAGLIRFLMRERHGTPFEHNSFRFHVRAPIFVAREWFRHRVGSFNEFSMRYAKATDDFYVPEPDDVRTQVGKPGAYSFEPVEPELAETARDELRAVYEAAFETYQRLVEAGVARELEALAQGHPIGVRERPEVDRRLQVVAPGRGAARVGPGPCFTLDGATEAQGRGAGGHGRAEGRPTGDAGGMIDRHGILLKGATRAGAG
jgi:flavin-dependent thymidylate synthase